MNPGTDRIPIRVLVTGAGSIVGQGVVKALRASELPLCIIGADIHPISAALFRTDEGVLIPKVEEDGALPKVLSILDQRKVDVVMIGSEFDLEFFSKHAATIRSKTGACVVASPPETVAIADDKWATAEFLRKHDLPYAESYLPTGSSDASTKAKEWGFPVVLKTRTGTSSRHVHIVPDDETLTSLFPGVPNPMIQRVIAMPDPMLANEFTCSIFKSKEGEILGPFTARRTLRGGSSAVVEVAAFDEFNPLLTSIGQAMEVMGSLNVQVMRGAEGPVPFEFNARFSGTTPVRAHFGFNEPDMAIRNFHLGEPLPVPEIRTGLAVRYVEEVFVENVKADGIREPFPRGGVRPWF